MWLVPKIDSLDQNMSVHFVSWITVTFELLHSHEDFKTHKASVSSSYDRAIYGTSLKQLLMKIKCDNLGKVLRIEDNRTEGKAVAL